MKSTAPYHLINAAVNIQSAGHLDMFGPQSRDTDRDSPPHDLRGRRADFFLFSQHFVGADATGYCKTRSLFARDGHLDLGTAMAISGAAAAPNMGTSTIKPLVFLLTASASAIGCRTPASSAGNGGAECHS